MIFCHMARDKKHQVYVLDKANQLVIYCHSTPGTLNGTCLYDLPHVFIFVRVIQCVLMIDMTLNKKLVGGWNKNVINHIQEDQPICACLISAIFCCES